MKEDQLQCPVKFFISEPIPMALRLVSPWGLHTPGTYPIVQYIAQYTAYPSDCHSLERLSMAQRLQEATLWPGDCPYSPPQHTLASGTGIPMVPSIHSIQEGPGATQTTRLHSQPTESITKKPQRRQIQRKPDRGKYREIALAGGKYQRRSLQWQNWQTQTKA